MPLGTEVSLGLDHIVLDGDLAPHPQKGGEALKFSSMFIVAKRLDGSSWHLAWR